MECLKFHGIIGILIPLNVNSMEFVEFNGIVRIFDSVEWNIDRIDGMYRIDEI